jgi:uncharacterized membrane protein YesL
MFKIDSPFMNFLTKVADIMILNILFIIFSLPIFTIGASFTAAYYMGFKMVKDEETYMLKGFWKSFKENFVQSTIIWVIVLIAALVLVLDYRMILYSGIDFARWIRIAVLAVTAVVLLWGSFLFPMQARYTNTVKNTIKNAFLMAMSHLPTAAAVVVVWAVPGVIWYFFPQTIMVLVLLSFGLIFMFQSFLIMKVFSKYEEGLETAQDDTESGDGIFAESDRMEMEAAKVAKENKKRR